MEILCLILENNLIFLLLQCKDIEQPVFGANYIKGKILKLNYVFDLDAKVSEIDSR